MGKMYALETYFNEEGDVVIKQEEYGEENIIFLSPEQIPLLIKMLNDLISGSDQ